MERQNRENIFAHPHLQEQKCQNTLPIAMPNAGPLLEEEIKKLINVHGYNWECISPQLSSINKISAYHTFIHLKKENGHQAPDSPKPCATHQSEYSPSKLIISKGLFSSIPGRISQIDKSH
jgi:hypothetical protein